MNDTMITLVGNVVDTPRLRKTPNGTDVASFRIASTSRRWDREQGRFVDGSTLFVNVTCWRQFGVNIDSSLRKGQPVVVTGRFTMREYKVDEQPRSAYELEAVAVGHDLARGRSEFTRVASSPSVPAPQLDERGVPVDESDHWLGTVGDAVGDVAGEASGLPGVDERSLASVG